MATTRTLPCSAKKRRIVVPPLSFASVSPGILRSAHPMPVNFAYLDSLHLKTIVYLADQDYAEDNICWAEKKHISVFHFRMPVCREPFVENDAKCIAGALEILLDTRNYPVLCHSNKGKHRVGVLVGCLRRLQGWSLASIFNEYDRFSGGKGEADLEFIETFNLDVKYDPAFAPDWLSDGA